MNYIFRLLLPLIMLSGCTNEPALVFTAVEFTQSQLEICKTEACSPVSVDYIKVSGDSFISEKMNAAITSYIIEGLFLGDDATPTAKNIEQAAKDFILAYRDHQPDIPTDLDFGGYEAEVTVQKSYQNAQMVSIEANTYLFTGGAHGYGSTSYLNFDSTTGALIENQNLFQNYPEFESFAETKFKKAHGIAENDNINASGFWFENDRFSLPEAIGFDEHHLILIYNSYEIASYAAGPIILEIPLTEVTSYLDSTLL
ncbi:MAG: DUF4163 domain-containing protein [Bacteroidota bacterium]